MQDHQSTLNFMLQRKILLLLFCVLPVFIAAQVPYREIYTTWEDFLEYFTEEDGLSNDEIEMLSLLKEQPININTSNKETLQQLPFLTEQQIDSLLVYRQRKRQLLTLGELQFISGWDALTRRFTSLFTYAGDTLKSPISLSQKLIRGRHLIESRMDVPLYHRKGDVQQKGGYLGNNLKNITRYRFRYQEEMEFGLTLEKDAGEPFASQGNTVSDHQSFYLHYTSPTHKHKYILGDYTLNFGEGLLLGRSSFGGQIGLLNAPSRTMSRFSPHSGSDESRYYRGLLYSYVQPKFRITSFASYRFLDAKVENGKAVTCYTDGMHRTQDERNHKNALHNATLGVWAEIQHWGVQWGIASYLSLYDKEIVPQPRIYNRYVFRGTTAYGAAFSYQTYLGKRLHLSGELAADQRAHLALSQRIHFKATNDLHLSAQLRWFSKRYTAPFAQTINAASRVANEQGFLIGAKWSSMKGVKFETYVDIHRFPFATYRSNKSSHGLKFYTQLSKEFFKGYMTRLRYNYSLWQQNVPGHKSLLSYHGKHRLRLQHTITTHNFSTTGLLEGCMTHSQIADNKYGFTASLRGTYQFNSTLAAALYGAIFTTDDYSTSVYAYEPLLPNMSSFGALYFKGFRIAAQTKWTLQKRFTVGLRYSMTHYFDRNTIGSALQEIKSSTKADVNIYAQISL